MRNIEIGLLTAREALENKYEDALLELVTAVKDDDTSLIRHWEAYIRNVEAQLRRLDNVPADYQN
ncbi:MAG: hypothetical protein VX966_01965 [Chloroflexota bacterium]|nr:hypothetical protein [Chloroflexota bacterium]